MLYKTLTIAILSLGIFESKGQTNVFPSSGAVGIGTISPQEKLAVYGNAQISGDHPYLSLKSNNWNQDSYIQTGINLSGNATGDYLSFQIPANKGFNFSNNGVNRFVINPNGNVGIGTVSPLVELDVSGSINLKNGYNLTWGGAYGSGIPTIAGSTSGGLYFYPAGSTLEATMHIDLAGKIGIGTTTPHEKLSVSGNISAIASEGREVLTYLPTSYTTGDMVSGTAYKWYGDIWRIGNIRSSNALTGGFGISLENQMKFKVLPNGNIGIGTESPQEKLSVNGKIRAHEIKVEADNWPDYVFEQGYKVGTLEALENYIKLNKHLPEIPTAKETEANGIALGEMNKRLLKKIEELTLLLIEEHKQRKLDAARIDQLEQKLNPQK